MGRAKLNMELIAKEKSRNITFKKRKEGLIRKMHEFTTLCDVGACMIIYGPTQDKGVAETWPPSREEVRKIIDIYKAKSKDSGNKTFGLSDFFHDRQRKVEEELAKIRKKNMEAKYPTRFDFMNALPETQLREFAATLKKKLDYVKFRIQQFRGMELEIINQQAAMDQHNSMMMMLMNNDNEQFGGPSCSTVNVQPYSRQSMFYEAGPSGSAGGMADHHLMMCQSPKSLARYFPVMPSPYAMPCSVMPSLLPMQFSGMGGGGKEDAAGEFQMQMR